MSDGAPPPVFLERRSYRRRRMMDALRILPIVGVLLWLLPLFWPPPGAGPDGPTPIAMSDAIIYVFGVWIALILAALALWWALRSSVEMGEDIARDER